MSEVVVSPVADQVPGIKHKNPAIRNFLVSLIRQTPHNVFVDPFAGSGTFALNSNASNHDLLVPCELSDDVVEFGFTGVHRCDDDWRKFLQVGAPYSKDALLFLDPPRPRVKGDFGPYDREFTWQDWRELQLVAVDWPGPVIVATYFDDIMPSSGDNGPVARHSTNHGWHVEKVLPSGDVLVIAWWGEGWGI